MGFWNSIAFFVARVFWGSVGRGPRRGFRKDLVSLQLISSCAEAHRRGHGRGHGLHHRGHDGPLRGPDPS